MRTLKITIYMYFYNSDYNILRYDKFFKKFTIKEDYKGTS